MAKKNQKTLSNEQINKVVSLYNNGKFQDAIESIKLLNVDYPNVPLLFNLIGACYKSIGQIDAALKMFKTATEIKPDYAEAYFNQGVILKSMNRVEDAIECYKKAVSILPNYPDAHNNLGNAYKEIEMFKEAIDSYDWAIAHNPNFAIAHNNLGILYSDLDQEVAFKHFKKAANIKPDYSEAYFNMGTVLRQLGRRDESISSYEKAIEIKPDYIDAYKNLSAMKTFKRNDPQINLMKLFLTEDTLSQKDQISINFALAKVNEDLGNSEDFFKFLNKGNDLRKKELNYSFELDQEIVNKIKGVFGDSSFSINRSLYKPASTKPIFIVGMPRSGTSLVEQIISSHHEVHGAGELEYMTKYSFEELKTHYRSNDNNFKTSSFISIREKYLDSISNINRSKDNIITDKMPLNFRFIGFILSAFPEAKIVHLKRDARATCWSIYKYYFKSDGNGYSYNLKDLTSYFALYKNLMDYWHKLYPNKIYDVSYESLTINQEEETRKLLTYCDLEWDENCLNFHKNNRAVKTTSALQVRQKMYQGSSDAWKKYEVYLKTLVDDLKTY
jgi:tetratricopeptide (TPR) repeat protein